MILIDLGGFFVIVEKETQEFANDYFKGFNLEHLRVAEKLNPNILILKPSARLSCHTTTSEPKYGK